MTTKQLEDLAWTVYPYTYRNNRGIFRVGKSFIRCGIPEPRGNEKPDDKKGGDRIGWTPVEITSDMVGKTLAVFINIEIKGPGDTLKPGQIKWHNFVLEHGGLSEIWYDDGMIIKGEIDEQSTKSSI
jgi:hypothetical protein